MEIQQQISNELLQQKVGTTEQVIIDRLEGDYYIGRTQYDSPEVDCEVLIKNTQDLQTGTLYKVLIERAEDFDLYGEIVQD